MFRYITEYKSKPDYLLFAKRNRTHLGRRTMLRNVKRLM